MGGLCTSSWVPVHPLSTRLCGLFRELVRQARPDLTIPEVVWTQGGRLRPPRRVGPPGPSGHQGLLVMIRFLPDLPGNLHETPHQRRDSPLSGDHRHRSC